MDFRFNPEQEALRKEFDDFFREEMAKAPPEWGTSMEAMFGLDVCWEFHKKMAKKLAAKGWLSRAWPREYGGQDAPLIEQFIFSEVQGYYRGAGVDPWGVGMLAPTLLYGGSDEQKKEHLPPIARAELFWTQLWSEPGAGSDLASLTTRATRDGDDYVVNGQKIWTSGAHRADWGFMIARTNPEEKRSRGISFFLVDMKSPGITINPVLSLEGSHLFNEVFFDDVRVPARNMVGKENEGWLASQMMSNFERSMIILFSFLRRELEELVEFCKETKRGGKPLAENPHIRHKLAQLAIDIETGRAFAYFIVWNQEKHGLIAAGSYAAAAKVLATELNQRFSYIGCEILGLYGQVEYSKWAPLNGKYEKEYLQSISLNMGGGTSEVMRNLVCSLALGLPRSW
ncbi:MAG TPA: pimeloyl-CoA dehydrogenase large subunit [Dehalococcoidia bacterium]|nr:pimeloyl-CoA dehydrogenase large subunit [Dehalococcoidia bacterium]